MQTDTRHQILATIRDQELLLCRRQGAGEDSNSSGAVQLWADAHWHEAFQFLFVTSPQAPESEAQHHDDLLFFVRAGSSISGSGGAKGEAPFFVRRRSTALPAELCLSGNSFGDVDWPHSVLLNLVLQAQYQLTVVACGQDALPYVADGQTWLPGMAAVSKRVYASPTITAVNLDSSRTGAAAPVPCYPDVCFAVDSFDDAFEHLVLDHPQQCYCVVLHALLDSSILPAHSGMIAQSVQTAALLKQQQQQQQHDLLLQQQSSGGTVPSARRRLLLFAGYVSHAQVDAFLEDSSRGRGLLGALLRTRGAAGQQDSVTMTGPGGVGRAEVAVTRVAAPSASPNNGSGAVAGAQGLLQRARALAAGVQQALADGQPSQSVSDGTPTTISSLVCAMMLLRLPTQHVARELLGVAAA